MPLAPAIVSSPAPPSSVRAIACAARSAAEIASLPSRPLTASSSVGSWCWIATRAARPETATPEASPLTSIASLPLVPLTMTLSVWPSPVVPPSVAARSVLTVLTSVPVRSLTVMVSAPPSALKSTVSTPAVSMVMSPGSRKNRSRLPLADRSTCSAALAPLNTIVSLPASPSTVSLPSPGSQTNVSSPEPRSARSLPPLPSIESLPAPPCSRSAPVAAGEIVVSVSPVERRRDAVGEDAVALVDAHEVVAGAASTTILATNLRSTLKSAEPSSPASTWRMSGPAGLQAKRNPVACGRALDDQRSVLPLGALEHDVAVPIRAASGLVGRGGVGRHGRNPACAGDCARHGHCHARKPRRANVVGSKSILHLYVSLCVRGCARRFQGRRSAMLIPGRTLTVRSWPPPRWNARLTQLAWQTTSTSSTEPSGCGGPHARTPRISSRRPTRVLGRGRPLGHADDLCSRRTPRCTTDRA